MRLFFFKILDKIDKLLVVLMFSLLFASSAYAASEVCATGFGSVGYDDTYPLTGTENSRPKYDNGTYQICYQGAHWQFHPLGVCDGGPDVSYYDAEDGSEMEPFDVPSWEVGAGDSPAGEITDCSPVEEATTTAATTTVAMLGSIAFGQGIMILLMSLLCVGLVYNSFTTKQPWR